MGARMLNWAVVCIFPALFAAAVWILWFLPLNLAGNIFFGIGAAFAAFRLPASILAASMILRGYSSTDVESYIDGPDATMDGFRAVGWVAFLTLMYLSFDKLRANHGALIIVGFGVVCYLVCRARQPARKG
jgi:hypothetical protein